MPATTSSELGSRFGSENVARLAAAYQAAITTMLGPDGSGTISRDVRLEIVRTLIGEAQRDRFDPEHLREVALRILGRSVPPQS